MALKWFVHFFIKKKLSLLLAAWKCREIFFRPFIKKYFITWNFYLIPEYILWIKFAFNSLLLLIYNTVVLLYDSLQPNELQLQFMGHSQTIFVTCPSISPGVCSNSCSLSQWCHPTISSSVAPFLMPSIFPTFKVFSNELALHNRWPKYWSFSISPSNEHSRLIFFRIDWFDSLTVQGTLKSLLQHHNWKASIFWCSALFIV